MMTGKVEKEYIVFQDPAVEAICITKWSSDGIGLTYKDAAKVSDIGTTFQNNTSIEYFNELQYFTSCKTINRLAFYGCTALKELDCRNITGKSSGNAQMWRSCSSLYKLVLRDYSSEFGFYGTLNNDRSCMAGCTSLKRLILPNAPRLAGLAWSSKPTFQLIDLGSTFNNFRSSGSSYNAGCSGINGNTKIVLRNTTPADGSSYIVNSIRKLYVPASALDDYKAAYQYASITSYIFAIGGEEWVADFGSTDEYADLTQEEKEINYPNA